jgi:hypothetical protein
VKPRGACRHQRKRQSRIRQQSVEIPLGHRPLPNVNLSFIAAVPAIRIDLAQTELCSNVDVISPRIIRRSALVAFQIRADLKPGKNLHDDNERLRVSQTAFRSNLDLSPVLDDLIAGQFKMVADPCGVAAQRGEGPAKARKAIKDERADCYAAATSVCE